MCSKNIIRFILLSLLTLICTLENLKSQNNRYLWRLNKAALLQQQGSFNKSNRILKKIIEQNPNSDSAYYLRAYNNISLKKYSDAIIDFDSLLRINPSLTEIYGLKAKTFFELKEYDKSSSCFSEAILKDKANAPYYYAGRAYINYITGNYEKANQDCDAGINLDPKYSYLYDTKGDIYFKENKYTEALASYKKALDLKPSLSTAYIGIIKIYQALNDSIGACEYYRKAKMFANQEIRDSIDMRCNNNFSDHSNYAETAEMEYFKKLALSNQKMIGKWVNDIRIDIVGNYKSKDVKAINKFIEEVNPYIFPLKMTIDSIDPNTTIIFVPRRKFYKYILGAPRHPAWIYLGGLTVRQYGYNGKINSSTITVHSKIIWTKYRSWIIRHELLHALGLDHSSKITSSIHSSYQGIFSSLSLRKLDRYVIKLLYSEKISPEFSSKDIDAVFRKTDLQPE